MWDFVASGRSKPLQSESEFLKSGVFPVDFRPSGACPKDRSIGDLKLEAQHLDGIRLDHLVIQEDWTIAARSITGELAVAKSHISSYIYIKIYIYIYLVIFVVCLAQHSSA